jgi:hypothetical protein
MHLTKILEHYLRKRKQRRKNNTRDDMQKQNNNFKSIEVQQYLLASSATLQQAGRT